MIFAVGDIHGSIIELIALHKNIMKYAPDEVNKIVFLGDYIDRGRDSKAVIEWLLQLPFDNFEHVFLKGNHELMADDAFSIRTSKIKSLWIDNGGATTLRDYNMNGNDIKYMGNNVMPNSMKEFFKLLKPYHIDNNLLFIHAGINPYVLFDQQNEGTWLWIRDKFLSSVTPFSAGFGGKEMRVVHGHTPVTHDPGLVHTNSAIVKSNRINLDTGASWTNKLSCAVFNNNGTLLDIITNLDNNYLD